MTHPDRERLAVLVHEVRSPVAALRAIAETYQSNSLETTEREPLVELAIAACLGIERLIRDVTVSSVRLEPTDIGRLVEDVVAAAALGGGNVRPEIDAGLPLLRADPLRLRQALDNLVWNALRHAGSSKEVVIRARLAGAFVLLSVADQGPRGSSRRAGEDLCSWCSVGYRPPRIGARARGRAWDRRSARGNTGS